MLGRICRLLSPPERKMGLRVVCAVLFSALLDFAGLAALLPVLFFLIGDGEDRSAAWLFCAGAVAFILLKNGLVAGLSRFRNRFVLSLYRRLSFSLFTSYYNRGMMFIRSRGSVRLGREANYVCYAFALNVLSPLLRMAGDGLLLLLVTVALSVYAPLTALMLYASFVPFMLIYGMGVKKRMRRYGDREQQVRREQSRLAVDTLKGYAELELNAAFPALQRSFVEGLERISECRLKLETVQHLPLCLSEVAVVVALSLLAVFGTGDVKEAAGVFAVAAFRLLPALRGILGGWTQVQHSACFLRIVEEGLEGWEEAKEDAVAVQLPFRKGIEVSNVSFVYPDGRKVLDGFSCVVRKGEYVGICGESGIGKSTLFNLLLGFFTPASGEIRVDGIRLDEPVKRAWHRKVGYVQQDVFILDGTLAENIALGCGRIDRERAWRVLRQVCLDSWAEGLPQQMDTPLGECGGRLSGGQRQRVGIARALYKEAEVLLLDEATSALDNDTERAINRMLLRLMEECGGLTILSIAHRESSLAYCHRIINLKSEKNG